ncbi:unnamed protein product [Sphacelaria rigidula]
MEAHKFCVTTPRCLTSPQSGPIVLFLVVSDGPRPLSRKEKWPRNRAGFSSAPRPPLISAKYNLLLYCGNNTRARTFCLVEKTPSDTAHVPVPYAAAQAASQHPPDLVRYQIVAPQHRLYRRPILESLRHTVRIPRRCGEQ